MHVFHHYLLASNLRSHSLRSNDILSIINARAGLCAAVFAKLYVVLTLALHCSKTLILSSHDILLETWVFVLQYSVGDEANG